MTKNYRKNFRRKSKKGFLFCLVLIMLGLVVTFNIADIISSFIMGKGSIFYNGNIYLSAKTFYAISIDSFEVFDDALECGGEVAQKGGAGYIYQSGEYYVLLAMYSSQLDAKSVQEKLREDKIESKIVNINIPKFTFKFSDKDEKIADVAKEFLKSFDFLYDLAIKYDAGSASYEQTIITIKNKIAELEYIRQVTPSSKQGLVIKEKSLKMIELLKSLTLVEKEGYLFNSTIKYTYFEIVFDYIKLCKSISWFLI